MDHCYLTRGLHRDVGRVRFMKSHVLRNRSNGEAMGSKLGRSTHRERKNEYEVAIFKGLTARPLYRPFGVKGLTKLYPIRPS